MATVTDVQAVARPAGAAAADERLAFRGPIQRVLMRPEIGALVGTTAVWLFFWAVGGVFGTAAGTASYLDVAAGLGIMAVAVSLLMIGGEFDLSSGAMTGATAMLVIMFSKEVGELGGAGLTLHLAVPLSLAFALMIGWFNGTVVEKTRLPSFIVTLGTFFVLIGAKLGFSKLFSGQVVVEGLNEAAGYGFWRKVFAASWIRNDHIWNDRDVVWTILVIAGVALIAAGVLEMSYRRARTAQPQGPDRVRRRRRRGLRRVLRAAQQRRRLEERGQRGARRGRACSSPCSAGEHGGSRRSAGAARSSSRARRPRSSGSGSSLVAAGVVLAAMFNPDSQNAVGMLVSDGFARSLFTIGIGSRRGARRARRRRQGAGVVAARRSRDRGDPSGGVPDDAPGRAGGAVRRARRGRTASSWSSPAPGPPPTRPRPGWRSSSLTAVVVVGLAFFIRSESTSEKFRTQLFTVMLLIALALACSALLGYLFAARTGPDPAADKLG